MPRALLAGLILAAVPPFSSAPGAPATRPGSNQLDQALRDLGDERFDVRDRASDLLFHAGPAIAPLLHDAAANGPPEARLRAESILARFGRGVFPDTPAEVAALAERCEMADEDQKPALLMELARRGPYGCVVLMKLAEHEPNLELKDLIARLLAGEIQQAPQSAAILLGSGDPAAAERLLEAAADSGDETAVRAYAALLLSQHKLDAKRRDLQARADRGGEVQALKLARTLVWFHRAAGDLPRAAAAAEAAHDDAIAETLALERRDWKRLAQLLARRIAAAGGERDTAIRQLGFLAAAQRLAGDDAACDQTLATVRRLCAREPASAWTGASIFLLNERLAAAIELLTERHEYVTAFELLNYAGRYEEALALLDAAQKDRPADAPRLAAMSAALQWRLGRRGKALALLDDASTAAANDPAHAFGIYVALVEAEREIGRAADPAIAANARSHAAAALECASGNDNVAWLFGKLYPHRGTVAGQWWEVLASTGGAAAAAPASKREALDTLDAVMAGRLSAAEWEALVERANDTTAQPPIDALRLARRYQFAIDALQSAGQADLAAREFQNLAGLSGWVKNLSRETYVSMADGYGRQGKWPQAAATYEACANHHGGAPDLLWLRGYAIQQSDPNAAGGAEMMARARDLSLADERRMALLADAMATHGHADDALAQRRAILRLGHPRGWTWYDECKTLGNELSRRPGDATAAAEAADLWQLFAIQVLDSGGAFSDDLAYVQLPQLVHQFRARGFSRAGKLPEAMNELRAFLALAPTHIEPALEAVPELKKLGHPAEARELFDQLDRKLDACCTAYPDSAYFQNEIAWLAVKCGYEPDAALAHAKRAVQLLPRDTASLDTLAEILYRRGDRDQAIALIKQCESLEPDQPRHRQRREQFEKGALSDE